MNQLQQADGVVKSVLEVRAIMSHMNDLEFSLWYEDRYMITHMRVMGILRAAEVQG